VELQDQMPSGPRTPGLLGADGSILQLFLGEITSAGGGKGGAEGSTNAGTTSGGSPGGSGGAQNWSVIQFQEVQGNTPPVQVLFLKEIHGGTGPQYSPGPACR
jgi:hypothetical protein